MISSSKSLFKSFSRYHYQRNIFNKNIPFAKYAESNNYLKKEGGIEGRKLFEMIFFDLINIRGVYYYQKSRWLPHESIGSIQVE